MKLQSGLFFSAGRYSAAFLVISIGIVTLLGSGGGNEGFGTGGTGSGGGNGGFSTGGTDNAVFQANYTLTAAGIMGGITMSYTDSGGAHSLIVNPSLISGSGLDASVACDTSTQVCDMTSLNAGTSIEVVDDGKNLYGDFTMQVNNNVGLDSEEVPTSGIVQVDSAGGTNNTKLTFTACTGGPGVQIQLNDTNDLGCYVWTDFLNLANTSTDSDLLLALLAYQTLNNLLETVEFAKSTFSMINDSVAQSGGTIDKMCEAFSDSNLVAPTGVADQGTSTFTWTDDNPDGNVGSGDSFRLDYTDCWQNNTEDSQHELLSGGVDLVNYNYATNTNNELTNIGFDGTTAGKTGGIFYDAFTLQVTSSDASNNATIESTLDLSGGITFKLAAP